MGLAFSVKGYECKAHWSYSGFSEFRKRLARTIGIDLDEMKGFYKRHPNDEGFIKMGWKDWDSVQSPLKYLLNHSDCDGYLTAQQCKHIYPILFRIIEEIWEVVGGHDHDHVQGGHLAAAMRYCADNNMSLHFC